MGRGGRVDTGQVTRRIDLHTHSTASDGTTAPAELVRQGRAQGLDVLALTDHETTAGWQQATEALPAGLALVPGVELSCQADGISLHLLGYLFDPDEPELAAARKELRESRVHRAERMADSLAAAGTGVTWEQVRALADGTVGRPHLAQALMEQGLVGSVEEAFTPEWIGPGGPHFRGKFELDAVQAVRMIVAAGGVAVFAHPSASKRGRTVAEEVIAAMAAAGLAGIEVDHPDHDQTDRLRLRALADDLGLLVTGSSDFHGSNKTVALGANLTDEAVLEAIVERASGSVVRRSS